jgi:autotransporter-associated beta strand protein
LGYNNANAIGGTNVKFVIAGGTLDNTSGAAITTSTSNPVITWNGDFTFAGSNGANSNLNLGTGAVALNATRQVTVTNAASTLTLGGVISGATFGITKAGAGTLTLGGTNAYTGATLISAGTLEVTGSIATSSGITNNAALTFNSASAQSYGNAINGTGTLTKQGGGILTLGGTNGYTGLTTISGTGTLALGAAGSINNSSGVALGTAGTFDVSAKSGGYSVAKLTGSGTVIGALTVTTELAIGNSPGVVTYTGDLTLGAASTSKFEVIGGSTADPTVGDLGVVNGLLTISAGAILNLVQLGAYTANDKFTLFAYNTLSGTFAGMADDTNITDNLGGIWTINYNDNTAGLNGGVGAAYITVTAVPEPGAALIGSLGLLALLRRRRS